MANDKCGFEWMRYTAEYVEGHKCNLPARHSGFHEHNGIRSPRPVEHKTPFRFGEGGRVLNPQEVYDDIIDSLWDDGDDDICIGCGGMGAVVQADGSALTCSRCNGKGLEIHNT